MAREAYQPPKQGTAGMIVDSLLMLVLVFAALKAPAWIAEWQAAQEPAAAATEAAATDQAAAPTVQWSDLGQNAVMQTAWEKLGKDPAAAKAIIDNKFDYSINVFKLLSVAALVAFYFFYMLTNSFKEYRDVIEERFGNESERSNARNQRMGDETMDIWNIAEDAAWVISIALALWMVIDMFKTGAQYNESVLLSSREGADELLDQGGVQ